MMFIQKNSKLRHSKEKKNEALIGAKKRKSEKEINI